MKLWIIIISILNSFQFIGCDYYGTGFPVRSQMFVPTYIRYKRIPVGYLGSPNRFGGHHGGNHHHHVSGHENDQSESGHEDQHEGNSHESDHDNSGLIQRYLSFLTPASHRGPSYSFLPNRLHHSHEIGHSDHGGGHKGGLLSFAFGGHSDDHSYSNHHDSSSSPGLLGIRVNRFSLFRRPLENSLLQRIIG